MTGLFQSALHHGTIPLTLSGPALSNGCLAVGRITNNHTALVQWEERWVISNSDNSAGDALVTLT